MNRDLDRFPRSYRERLARIYWLTDGSLSLFPVILMGAPGPADEWYKCSYREPMARDPCMSGNIGRKKAERSRAVADQLSDNLAAKRVMLESPIAMKSWRWTPSCESVRHNQGSPLASKRQNRIAATALPPRFRHPAQSSRGQIYATSSTRRPHWWRSVEDLRDDAEPRHDPVHRGRFGDWERRHDHRRDAHQPGQRSLGDGGRR